MTSSAPLSASAASRPGPALASQPPAPATTGSVTEVGAGSTLFKVRDSTAQGWVGQLNTNGAGKTLRTKGGDQNNQNANRLVGLHLYKATIAEGRDAGQVLYYLKDQGKDSASDRTYPLVWRDKGNTIRPWQAKTLSEVVARAETLIEKGAVGRGLDYYSQEELNGSPVIASTTLKLKDGQSVPVIANSKAAASWAGDAEVGRQGAVISGINGNDPTQRAYWIQGRPDEKGSIPRWPLDISKAAPAKPEAKPAAREQARKQQDDAALVLARKHIKHGHASPERLYPYEEQKDIVLNGWGGPGSFVLGAITGKLPGRASMPGNVESGLFFPTGKNGRLLASYCTTAVLETHALHGIPNPPATGGDPINPRGAAVQYIRDHGWTPVKLPGGEPITLNSPYGKATVQVLTAAEYQQAVKSGLIRTGDLVFQTQHTSWNQRGVRSSGYDTAIAINGGHQHHNGAIVGGKPDLAGTLVYGDNTKSVFVLRNPVRQIQFEAQLFRQGGAGDLQRAGAVDAVAGPFAKVRRALEPLLARIRQHEGGFDSVNRGTAGDTPNGLVGLSRMTIGQVQSLQMSGKNRLHAVGAYQFIKTTLEFARRQAGLPRNALFSPENQHRMAVALLLNGQRANLAAFLTGRSSNLVLAHRELALEFASFTGPNGRGMHDGIAGNRGSVRPAEVRSLLLQARKDYMAQMSRGNG